MKYILFVFAALLVFSKGSFAQTSPDTTILYEWNIKTTGTSALGERVVAYINSGTIGPFIGGSIVGQVIDGNGNWGYQVPAVANFKASVNFSNSVYQLQQDVSTANITLELKSMSPTQVALVANCPLANKQMRVFFRLTNTNGATITKGSSSTIITSGTMLISQPTYQSTLTGSLLLNVTTPSSAAGYTLAVGGKVIAESVTVKLQNSWPDYVFKSNYRLQDLSALKNYINKNHHLPDVPSAGQVDRDGLNLGDMNKLLMKKTEELTLYLIEKDKKLKEEQLRNTEQENKLTTQQEQINIMKKQLDAIEKQLNKKKS